MDDRTQISGHLPRIRGFKHIAADCQAGCARSDNRPDTLKERRAVGDWSAKYDHGHDGIFNHGREIAISGERNLHHISPTFHGHPRCRRNRVRGVLISGVE